MTGLLSPAQSISLVPTRLNLRLYAGDGAMVRLTFNQGGAQLSMDEGVLTAEIRAKRLDPEPAAIWAVESGQASEGVITLTLTGAETAKLLENYNAQKYRAGFKGSWDAQWHPNGLEPVTLFQGDCFCDADVTR